MRSKISTIILTMIVLLFSIYQDEPILSTSAMLYLPFLFATLALKSKEYLYYAQKYLLFIVFIYRRRGGMEGYVINVSQLSQKEVN